MKTEKIKPEVVNSARDFEKALGSARLAGLGEDKIADIERIALDAYLAGISASPADAVYAMLNLIS